MILNKTKLSIKTRIYNASLISGNKKTVEKNLLKSLKKIQKMTNKDHTQILKLAIKNLTPTLKMDKQKMKRRKRKANQEIPTFIRNNFLRVNLALKYITQNSNNRAESNQFGTKLADEIISSANFNSSSIDKKTELQNKVLLQKTLFFKYRWKK